MPTVSRTCIYIQATISALHRHNSELHPLLPLLEHVVVVNRVVMADVPELHLVRAEEFKDDAIGSIDTKAPHFVMFGVELLCVEGWVNGFSRKRSVLEAAFR